MLCQVPRIRFFNFKIQNVDINRCALATHSYQAQDKARTVHRPNSREKIDRRLSSGRCQQQQSKTMRDSGRRAATSTTSASNGGGNASGTQTSGVWGRRGMCRSPRKMHPSVCVSVAKVFSVTCTFGLGLRSRNVCGKCIRIPQHDSCVYNRSA